MKSNVDDKCGEVYRDLKFKKAHRFIVYKIDQEKVVHLRLTQVIEALGDREGNWKKFMETLPPKEPRMCVFDLEYTNNDGMHCSKLFFCYWLPDGTPLKLKLTYASFKENFKTYLDVGGKEIVLNSADDVLNFECSIPSKIWSRNLTNDTHSLH